MNDKDALTYFIASIKDWHKPSFDAMRDALCGDTWLFIDSPESLHEALTHVTPRYIFFLHWNERLPKEIWSRIECVCFHMTDVPYGRGGSPLQNLIARGHRETKLSALRMQEELDAGPVYAKVSLPLEGSAEEIYIEAGKKSLEMARWIAAEEPEPVPQQGEVFVFKRRAPSQSLMPDKGSLDFLYDHIRMLDAPGYPLAFMEYGDFRIEFSNADIKNGEIHANVVIRKK
jgi:methionyl-tRNA formyltransferase